MNKIRLYFKYWNEKNDGLLNVRTDYIIIYVNPNTTYEELENKCIKYVKRKFKNYMGLYEIKK